MNDSPRTAFVSLANVGPCLQAIGRVKSRASSLLPMRVFAFGVGAALFVVPVATFGAKGDKPDKIEKFDKVMKAERSQSERPSSPAPSSSRGSSSSGQSSRSSSKSLPPATPSTAAAAQFEPYRMIVDRNIFNPNRTGRSRSADEAPAPKIDQIALVGTMESDEGGRVAFFDSAEAAHRKSTKVGDEIAGFTVKLITPTGVELVQDEKKLTLRVNQQLRRIAGGDWRVTGRDPLRADVARPGESSSPSGSTVPANASDVLRRLMEQRQKQLKQ
jgi:hypothetical protein